MGSSRRSRPAVAALVFMTVASLLNASLVLASETGEQTLQEFGQTKLAAGPATFRVPGTGVDLGPIQLCAVGTCTDVPAPPATQDTWYRLTLLVEKADGSKLSYTQGECPDVGEEGVVIELFGTSSDTTVEALLEQEIFNTATQTKTWEKVASIGDHGYVEGTSKSPEASACI